MDNIRILIVEHEPITAMDIKKRLDKLRHSVLDTVHSGKEAIASVKKTKPDLILMDINLPGSINGSEAAKIISDNYNIPIIFITDSKDNEKLQRAQSSVLYGSLTKPLETRDIQNVIELALCKHGVESKLDIAEQRYKTLMDNASCAIFTHNREGVIYDINKKGATLFGDVKSDILGQDFINYFHPSERQYARIQLKKLLIEKHIDPTEARMIQPNGKIIDVEYSASCVKIRGEEMILSIVTDITHSNQLRAQSLLNDKLATIGTLATGIIHEINNPLSWVLSNLAFFKENLSSLQTIDDQKKLATLNTILEETINGAQRIQEIVHNLKGFTRLDDKELVPTDINQIILTVIKMVKAEIKNQVQIITNLQPNIPSALMSAGKLQQVFLNLVMNAIQAFSKIDLNKNIITISTRSNEDQILVDVHDTGEGISDENIKRVFDPFFTTKPAGKGTGLGLLICYDILHSMGGTIDVESSPTRGTTFTVILPLQLKAKLPKYGEIPAIIHQRRLNVLIVDDESFLLKSLNRVLEDKFEVTSGLGGRTAIDILDLHKDKFDIIISDLYMPDISGADLYGYIAEKYPGLEDRIIFLSGSIPSQSQADFFKTINNPILTKPFELKDLYQAIATISNLQKV